MATINKTFRGSVAATGADPMDRIIVTAVVAITDAIQTVLAGSEGSYSATVTVVSAKFTRASTEAVSNSTGSISATCYFGEVRPNAPGEGRLCSVAVTAMGTSLFAGSAHCTMFDEIVETVDAPPPVTPSPVGDGLLGNYYTGGDIIGVPQVQEVDPTVNFVPFDVGNVPLGWAPGLPWSIRWTGEVEAPVAGNYQFRVTADDGSRLTLDGVTVLNDWGSDHGAIARVTATYTYTAGQHIGIWLDLRNEGGVGVIKLEWKYPGQDWQVIPTAYLFSGEGVAPPVPPAPVSPPDRMKVYIETINRYPEA